MHAKLISITKPLGDLADLTPEQFITYQARVSSPRQRSSEGSERLLRYCLKHGHWSVFDMVDVTYEIETSRAIMAQVLRHWSFRFQEFSQRYSEAGGVEPVEIREAHVEGNRQGSGERLEIASMTASAMTAEAFRTYGGLIDRGAAPECARMLLPLATTTKAYMKGSVRSWITYFWQRLDSHAQKEHRELAEAIFTSFEEHFPVIAGLVRNGKMQYVETES